MQFTLQKKQYFVCSNNNVVGFRWWQPSNLLTEERERVLTEDALTSSPRELGFGGVCLSISLLPYRVLLVNILNTKRKQRKGA